MAKLHRIDDGDRTVLLFYCPGCKAPHPVRLKPDGWTWNGSLDAPTFSPSLLCNQHHPESRCHSFICVGKIKFLSDCWHELKDQTVAIPEWEDWPC